MRYLDDMIYSFYSTSTIGRKYSVLSSLANLTHFIGQKFRGVLYILLNCTFSEQLLLQNIMFIMCRERRNLNQKKECNFCKLAAKIHDLVRNKSLPNFC